MSNQAIVRLEHIRKVFLQGRMEVIAVNDLSLDLTAGDFAALCGPSGSGKTTVLNLIGGLDLPTSGKVMLAGHDLAALSRSALSAMRRDRIGFVFQSYNLIPVMTAFENAEFVLKLQGISKSECRDRVMAILRDVGLEGLENRRPDERKVTSQSLITAPTITTASLPSVWNIDGKTALKPGWSCFTTAAGQVKFQTI